MNSRRAFLKTSGGAIVLTGMSAQIFMTGCKGTVAGTWVSEALNILQLIEPAVAGILTLAGIPVPPILTSAISALIDLIKKYEAAPVDQQPSLILQIQAAAKFLQDNVAEILNAIHVVNSGLQAKVIALVNFVVGELSALISLIPGLKVGASVPEAKAAYAKVPAKTAAAFKALYNAQMLALVGDPSDAKVQSLILK